MKSERRHELQHNELAEWLFKTGEQIKPHQNLIMAAVVAIAVTIIGYTWWTRHAASRINQGWTELDRAMDAGSPDLFGAIADEYPDTVVGQTAAVLLGNLRLSAACNQRFAGATLAQRELKAAQDSYAKVLEDNISEALRERATYGMARSGRPTVRSMPPSNSTARWSASGPTAPLPRRQNSGWPISKTRKPS